MKTAILSALILVGGCGVANPSTAVSVCPATGTVKFEDTKDNNVLVEDLEVDLPNKVARVKKLELTNNASDVRIANVQQMDAIARQWEAYGVAMQRQITAISGVVDSLAGVVDKWTSNTGVSSWEGTIAAARGQSAALAEQTALLRQILERLPATTQPAGTDVAGEPPG